MAEQVELSGFDLRYESYRFRNSKYEEVLLASILQYGLKEPLRGVDTVNSRILLDGFKRYRCAQKLSISIVPYISFSDDEAMGIIKFLRMSTAKNLNILEQARLIDELITCHKMSLSDVATHLEKSKSWVSMRSGLISQMSDIIKEKIFSGKFPAYSFMYTLRPFIRMNMNGHNVIKKEEIDKFVGFVSGKGLSIRDIGLLANCYFRGTDNDEVRQQIESGDIGLCLNYLKERESSSTGGKCSELEQKMLKELEIIQRYINRVVYRSSDSRLRSNDFYSQANLLTWRILRKLSSFKMVLEAINDRSKNTTGDLLP
jgi:hypothetical protein